MRFGISVFPPSPIYLPALAFRVFCTSSCADFCESILVGREFSACGCLRRRGVIAAGVELRSDFCWLIWFAALLDELWNGSRIEFSGFMTGRQSSRLDGFYTCGSESLSFLLLQSVCQHWRFGSSAQVPVRISVSRYWLEKSFPLACESGVRLLIHMLAGMLGCRSKYVTSIS